MMAQYLIIFGPFGTPQNNSKNAVAFKTSGSNIQITCSKNKMNYWKNRINESLVLASSFKGNEVQLDNFAKNSSYVSSIFFDDSNYDEYKKLFESVNGVKSVVKIDRVPTYDEPDFDPKKVENFYKKFEKKK
jgi:hypothetical protein